MDKEVLHTRKQGQLNQSEYNAVLRNRPTSLGNWRPRTLMNFLIPRKEKVLHRATSVDNLSTSTYSLPSPTEEYKRKGSRSSIGFKNSIKKGWDTIVTIVVVEAKGLPDLPYDGTTHTLSCKIQLGSETFTTKSVAISHHSEWRERFTLRLRQDYLLRVSVWDKGKQRYFMGSCVIDLASFEKERSHEVWQELKDGFGSIHLNITMCAIKNNDSTTFNDMDLTGIKEKFAVHKLNDWSVVGQLYVKLLCARGLSGKPNAYCTLEIDNERVQTYKSKASSDPDWNKSYVFNVYDVTSILDIKVIDGSIMNALLSESMGKVSIPLLRVRNGECRWYALKDRNKRNIARGHCPRVLLEMSLIYNPVKAALRVFQPKEVKYIRKQPKFDIALLYRNMEFIKECLVFLSLMNETYKNFLEWENKEVSSVFLALWLIFWYHFKPWTAPLFLLLPFIYFWIFYNSNAGLYINNFSQMIQDVSKIESLRDGKSLTNRIYDVPELTMTVTNGVDYIVVTIERIYNLFAFQVPFMSYLTMILLVIASIVLYYVPVNYLIMGLGLYKYTRKYLNPGRKPNNDLLDFLSRIPDGDLLKEWKELSILEPSRQTSRHSMFELTKC